MTPHIHSRLFYDPRRALLWIALLCTVGALVLIGLNAHLGNASLETNSYSAVSVVSVASSPRQALPASSCWVTGDLVGDSNPATVAASQCGGH